MDMDAWQAEIMALRINRLCVDGVGHAWANVEVGTLDSTVTVRTSDGIEFVLDRPMDVSDKVLAAFIAKLVKARFAR